MFQWSRDKQGNFITFIGQPIKAGLKVTPNGKYEGTRYQINTPYLHTIGAKPIKAFTGEAESVTSAIRECEKKYCALAGIEYKIPKITQEIEPKISYAKDENKITLSCNVPAELRYVISDSKNANSKSRLYKGEFEADKRVHVIAIYNGQIVASSEIV